MYGDTGTIRRLAQRMVEQGDDIRRSIDNLEQAAESVRWNGRAATAMRERLRAQARRLRRSADEHDQAARALERHADQVDRLKARIAAIADKVSGLVEGARSRLASLADDALDAIDPLDKLLDDFTPPPRGHKAWLAVPDQLPAVFR